MIDATDILPLPIQQDYRDIKGLIRVDYNGKKYVRVLPFVVYEDEKGNKFQFESITWVECDKAMYYCVRMLDDERNWLEYDRVFQKHSIEDTYHHKEWEEMKPFLQEYKGHKCFGKHLRLDIVALFAARGKKIGIVNTANSRYKLYNNETRVKGYPLYDYYDCFTDESWSDDVNIQYVYGKSLDELECLVKTIQKEIDNLGDVGLWENLYNDTKDGKVTLETFITAIRGE